MTTKDEVLSINDRAPLFTLEDLELLMHNQREFQYLANVPIDDINKADELAEVFIYKAIEECTELKRTQPAALMKYAKTQIKQIDRKDMLHELSDIVLFLINFMIVRQITFEQLFAAMLMVQKNNFKIIIPKLKKELHDKLKFVKEFDKG